jgi:carbamoyl-phosphate synthase large subunit
MAGEKLSAFALRPPYPAGVGPDDPLPLADPLTLADPATPWFSVKEAVLPFGRFPGVDPLLGPEMRSTGEVMGWDRSFALAFLKAQMGAGTHLPEGGRVFLSIRDEDKTDAMAAAARGLAALGFEIVATRGTAGWLAGQGLAATPVAKVYEGRPNIVDRLKNGEIALVLNTTGGSQAVSDSRDIRRVSVSDRIPYFTTAAGAIAAVAAMQARAEGFGVRTLQG